MKIAHFKVAKFVIPRGSDGHERGIGLKALSLSTVLTDRYLYLHKSYTVHCILAQAIVKVESVQE